MAYDKTRPSSVMDRTINSIYLPHYTADEQKHSQNMKTYFAKKEAARKTFKDSLAARYLPERTEAVTDLVYQQAWSSHDVQNSYMYSATEDAYERLAEMLNQIDALQAN